MHELSVINSIFKTVTTELEHQGISSDVRTLRVTVGKFSNVIPEALQFAFLTARENTIFKNAELVILELDLICKCKDCGKSITMQKPEFICPECNSQNLKIVQGRELYIESIDI